MSLVDIEIDGKKLSASEGSMLIEAADQAGIYIPRFCYHKKLSIAANCRMCLIEVEKSNKPLPACATPVMAGMKAFTQSKIAMDAQKSVMEFLLINHPLDCPICDQGGECELQDLSMGYGKGVSCFAEGKRSVADEDLGPLIATEMTRCIHCTRCVRFGEEVAGVREIGATGRGEDMRIGTYVKHFVQSELSGNIIDLCPVGALTSKPYRFAGRAWEMQQHESIAPHDGMGSNIYIHTRGFVETDYRQVMRVVPRDNESINESWISDRDRFSYMGVNSSDRVAKPMVKDKTGWKEVDWPTALHFVVEALKRVESEQIGGLASASATVEELYLFQKLLRGMGVVNIDHRLHQTDFAHDEYMPLAPTLGVSLEEWEEQQAILLVGSYMQREQPMGNHRVRKAALKGATVMSINSVDHAFNFDIKQSVKSNSESIALDLAGVARALGCKKKWLKDIKPEKTHKAIAKKLKVAEKAAIFLGSHVLNHPQASHIRVLIQLIAESSGAKLGCLNEGGNAAGAWLAGVLPHRVQAGESTEQVGLNAKQMFDHPLSTYLLLGVEPELDSAFAAKALNALNEAFVVSLSPFCNERIKTYADVILPVAPFTETSGTFVNLEGKWQSFNAVTRPWQQVRPAWKVLRVLGNLFELEHFGYEHTDGIRDELKLMVEKANQQGEQFELPDESPDTASTSIMRIGDWLVNRVDMLVRRSEPLQIGLDETFACVRMNPALAEKLGLSVGDEVIASQGESRLTLPVVLDEQLAENNVFIPSGLEKTAGFGEAFAPITLKKVAGGKKRG